MGLFCIGGGSLIAKLSLTSPIDINPGDYSGILVPGGEMPLDFEIGDVRIFFGGGGGGEEGYDQVVAVTHSYMI